VIAWIIIDILTAPHRKPVQGNDLLPWSVTRLIVEETTRPAVVSARLSIQDVSATGSLFLADVASAEGLQYFD
jgi:hypothetical protein